MTEQPERRDQRRRESDRVRFVPFKTFAIGMSLLGFAFVALAVVAIIVATAAHQLANQVDSRASTRDAQHTTTENEIAALEQKLEASSTANRAATCTLVTGALQEEVHQNTVSPLVLAFARNLNCQIPAGIELPPAPAPTPSPS